MSPSSLLSPGMLYAVSLLVAGISVLMVAAHGAIFAVSAREAGISARARRIAPLLFVGALAVWAAWAVVPVTGWVTVPEKPSGGGPPVLLLEMLPPFAVAVALMFGSKTLRAVNAATPPAWLIGLQTYRVAGAMFLWPLLAGGAVSAGFALPAGIGDTVTGLFAPIVAVAVARGRPGAKGWAVAWNCFGILDLVAAPAAAVLTQSTNIGRYPLVIVALFLGPPLGILTHLYSLRNLAVTGGRARGSGI